jgi:hypothetical protein
MKKAILAIGLTAVLFSCKKREENEFTATDNTGTTLVTGTITKQMLTITPNGSNNTTVNNMYVPAEGVIVTVRVKKYGNQGLYPAVSENQRPDGFDSYTATTDANGRYSITVKSNGLGVQAQITTNEFTGTKDTLVGTTVKTGLLNVYNSSSGSATLFKGVNQDVTRQINGNTLVSAPSAFNSGTAIITGTVGIDYIKKRTNFNLDTTLALAGATVYFEYDRDPITLQKKTYTATTDAQGKYTITVATPNQNVSGFNQNGKLWINDRAATLDTFTVANSRVTGRPGVYYGEDYTIGGVYSTAIKNANHIGYYTWNFQQD